MRPAVALAALAALVLAAAGCGGGEPVSPTSHAEPEPAGSPPTVTTPAEPAPPPEPPAEPEPPRDAALEGETLDGARISSSDFRGRYLFVNVWSSW